jgi:hypothetical protein
MRGLTIILGVLLAHVGGVSARGSAADYPTEIAIKPIADDGLCLTHRDSLAWASPVHSYEDSLSARFLKVQGLADSKAISFQSFNNAGHYLRHRNGRLILTPCTTELDRRDATFFPVAGLAGSGKAAVSLESLNYPGFFVHRKGSEVWVDKRQDDNDYRTAATFRLDEPVAFKAINQPAGRWVLPTASLRAEEWRYTFVQPKEGWNTPEFDDSTWKVGPGGFGTWGPPQAVVRTIWNTPDIWLRRVATVPEERIKDVVLWLHHDDDADVYINGVLAAAATGYRTAYDYHPITPAARIALRPGDNCIAVHCKQIAGGQFIDVGLSNTRFSSCRLPRVSKPTRSYISSPRRSAS